MDRRLFLKRASGLFVAAAPALIFPKAALTQSPQVRQLLLAPKIPISSGGGLGLQTNCTGFWSFENTSWTDDTGNGTTLTGTASPTSVSGKVGNAVSLDGSTQYLTAASNTNILNGGSSFSVQCWVKIAASVGNEEIIFNKTANTFGNREWGFGTHFTSSNVFCFQCYNTSTATFRADSVVTIDANWHHLVATFNSSGGAIVLYVDGVTSGSGSTLTGTMNSTASAPLGIGFFPTAIINNATLVDQAGFWKGRILSASDVTSLYNSGNGLTYGAML